MSKKNNKSDFLKVYANLPVGLRGEIVIVIDDSGPVTWNVAYLEIVNDTNLGKIILEKLTKLEII
jgi:hypothetical protein